jgi:hypothetical protein
MSTSTASTTAFFLSLSSGCCTRKHHFHFNPSMFIYRLQNMMGKAWRKMGATARSSTYRRWRRRTDSSSVLHLLHTSVTAWLYADAERRRHRERPPWGRGAGREHPSSIAARASERSREKSTVVTGG